MYYAIHKPQNYYWMHTVKISFAEKTVHLWDIFPIEFAFRRSTYILMSYNI